jgi:hypothetical protein
VDNATGAAIWRHILGASVTPVWTGLHTHTITDAVTNAASTVIVLGHNSTGTPTGAFGGQLLFQLETSTTPDTTAGAVGFAWSNATHAAHTSNFFIKTVESGAEVTVAEFARGAVSWITMNVQIEPPDDAAFIINTFANDGSNAVRVSIYNDDLFQGLILSATDVNEDRSGIYDINEAPLLEIDHVDDNIYFANLALGEPGASGVVVDPAADRIAFWDDSASRWEWLTVGTGLSISDTTLSTEYTAAVSADWNSDPPATIAEALDRIAAVLGPIP